MKTACGDSDELARYVDGELSENRAAALREHVEGCSRCREVVDAQRRLIQDLAAPVAADHAALIARTVRRLDAPAPRAAWAPRWQWIGALGAAAAVVLLVAVRLTRPTDDDFHARGGTPSGDVRSVVDRHVGVTPYAASPARARLADGDRVTAATAYVVAYRNLYADAAVYLLAFAVDARGAVHWLYPAYLDATADPAATALPRADRDTMFPDAVAFEDVPTGPLRIVTIVSPAQLHVSSIERLPPRELTVAALRARWSDAAIHETTVRVVDAQEAP